MPPFDQTALIVALNQWLKYSPEPSEQSLQLDENGLCNGLAILSCSRRNFRAKYISFLAATYEERIKVDSEAWKTGRWFIDFLPVINDPLKPFVNHYHLQMPQTKSYGFADLDVLGHYTTNMHINKLTDAFKLLKQDNEYTEMVFLFNNHAIKIKYHNGKFGVYNPNDPNPNHEDLTWIYDHPIHGARQASKYILEVFSSTQKVAPGKITNTTPVNIHITVVKKKSDPYNPPQRFLKKLKGIDSQSVNKTDLYGVSIIGHTIYRRHTHHTPGLTAKQYLNAFKPMQYNASYFLQAVPTDTLIQVINDEIFKYRLQNDPMMPPDSDQEDMPELKLDDLFEELKLPSEEPMHLTHAPLPLASPASSQNMGASLMSPEISDLSGDALIARVNRSLEQSQLILNPEEDSESDDSSDEEIIPTKPEQKDESEAGIQEVIHYFRDFPDKQMVAACLYLLIKKEGKTLDEILISEFHKLQDVKLLEHIGLAGLQEILFKIQDEFINKRISNIISDRFVTDEYIEEVIRIKNPSRIYDVLMAFYFRNDNQRTFQFIQENKNSPIFLQELRKFTLKACEFSIMDNRNQWFAFLFNLQTKHFQPMDQDWLLSLFKLAIRLERKEMFVAISNVLTFEKTLEAFPLLYLAENSSSEFLRFALEHFSATGTLTTLCMQINYRAENPLHLAAFKNKEQHVQLLLQAGVTPLANSNLYETPLFIACARGHINIVKILFHYMYSKSLPIYATMLDNHNIFVASKKSNNPQMLPELVKLYLQTFSTEELNAILPVDILREFFAFVVEAPTHAAGPSLFRAPSSDPTDNLKRTRLYNSPLLQATSPNPAPVKKQSLTNQPANTEVNMEMGILEQYTGYAPHETASSSLGIDYLPMPPTLKSTSPHL